MSDGRPDAQTTRAQPRPPTVEHPLSEAGQRVYAAAVKIERESGPDFTLSHIAE